MELLEQIIHALILIYFTATCFGGAFFAFKMHGATITQPENETL